MQVLHRLLCLDPKNNAYKYYNIGQNSTGQVFGQWNRVGVDAAWKPSRKTVAQLLREKTSARKGYTDVTQYYQEKIVKDRKIAVAVNPEEDFLRMLQNYAGKQVQESYEVKATEVSQLQVDDATALLDKMAHIDFNDVKQLNQLFNRYLVIIPRHVPRHVKVSTLLFSEPDQEKLIKLLTEEVALLSAMRGQLQFNTGAEEAVENDEVTLSQLTGVSVTKLANVPDYIKTFFRDLHRSPVQVWEVVNQKTQAAFNSYSPTIGNTTETHLLAHSSGNYNWWDIATTGLQVKYASPHGLHGKGIYHSGEAVKSHQYIRGGQFMGLYEVKSGKVLQTRDRTHGMTTRKIHAQGYDSVEYLGYGHEMITYEDRQNTIKYLVQLS